MINKEKHIGEVFELKNNIKATIVEYNGSKDVDVILSSGALIKKVTIDNLKNKNVADPFEKTICGIGCIGTSKRTELRKVSYSVWVSLLKRCYEGKEINYIGCEVHESWHNFSNFYDWYYKNYFKGCCIDKDIKIKDNRTYSEDTCTLVPKEINNLIINNKRGSNNIIGVRKIYNKFSSCFDNKHIGMFASEIQAFISYKNVREQFIKEMAILYYSNGLISLDCYESLNKWTIEISD